MISGQRLKAAARSRASAGRLRQLAGTFVLEGDSALAMQEAQFFDVEAEGFEMEPAPKVTTRI